MGYGIVNRSAASPCPICGKPDWCGLLPVENGMEFHICMREDSQADLIGADGRYYIFDGVSKGGNARYEEAAQRKRRLDGRGEGSFRKGVGKECKRRGMKKVNEVRIRDNQYLDKVYRFLLGQLFLDPVHRCAMLQDGWTDEMLEKHGIKSFPEADYVRYTYHHNHSHNPYRKSLARSVIDQFGRDALLGVPGAYQDKKGDWTFAGTKGILFPCYDANGNLYRLRIRMDFMDVRKKLSSRDGVSFYEEGSQKHYLEPLKGFYTLNDQGEKLFEKPKSGKYRNFSSYHSNDEAVRKGVHINDYTNGCEAGNQLGFYYDAQRDNMFVCFVTEGEKKGIYANERMRSPFISVPGVNSWSKLFEGEAGRRPVDILKARGVGMFVVAYDADKSVNNAVLSNEGKVIRALKEEGFAVGTAEWDMVYGKGIDDLLANGHQPEYAIA